MKNDIPLKVVHLAPSLRLSDGASALLNLHNGLLKITVDSSILANPSASCHARIPFEEINRNLP